MNRHLYRLLPIISRLPEGALRFLHRRAPIVTDHTDGYTIWLDASYLRYCRRHDLDGRPHPMTLFAITCTHLADADVYGFYGTMFSETF